MGEPYWKTFKDWVASLDMTGHEVRDAIISAQDVFFVYLAAIGQDSDRHAQ